MNKIFSINLKVHFLLENYWRRHPIFFIKDRAILATHCLNDFWFCTSLNQSNKLIVLYEYEMAYNTDSKSDWKWADFNPRRTLRRGCRRGASALTRRDGRALIFPNLPWNYLAKPNNPRRIIDRAAHPPIFAPLSCNLEPGAKEVPVVHQTSLRGPVVDFNFKLTRARSSGPIPYSESF